MRADNDNKLASSSTHKAQHIPATRSLCSHDEPKTTWRHYSPPIPPSDSVPPNPSSSPRYYHYSHPAPPHPQYYPPNTPSTHHTPDDNSYHHDPLLPIRPFLLPPCPILLPIPNSSNDCTVSSPLPRCYSVLPLHTNVNPPHFARYRITTSFV